MKFRYNPTLDHLLLVAKYARASKTKKLEKILRGIATENTHQDIKSLNRLQSHAAQEREEYIVTITNYNAVDKGNDIIAIWSTTQNALMRHQWWGKKFAGAAMQFVANFEELGDHISKKRLATGEKKPIKISPNQLRKLGELPVWSKGVNRKGCQYHNISVEDVIEFRTGKRRKENASDLGQTEVPDIVDDRVVSVGMDFTPENHAVYAAWSSATDADRIYAWWPKDFPLPEIQLLASATDNLRAYGLYSIEKKVREISMKRFSVMAEKMMLWDEGDVDLITSKKKLLRSFKRRYRTIRVRY